MRIENGQIVFQDERERELIEQDVGELPSLDWEQVQPILRNALPALKIKYGSSLLGPTIIDLYEILVRDGSPTVSLH
jgi:hypothetical protein